MFTPEDDPGGRSRARRDRLHHRRDQDRGRLQRSATRITDDRTPAAEALPGFKPSVPVVWCGLYPVDADDFEKLRESLGKLRLNDASFHYEPETSAALGFGFRCGFLGLLHLEIIQERLTREFDLDLIATAPSVVYRVHRTNGDDAGAAQPGRHAGRQRDRPYRGAVDHAPPSWCPTTISAPCCTLCNERRGEQVDLTYVGNRAMAVYRLPLNEVVFDFYDRLKSVSPRLCQLRLRRWTAMPRATWCASPSW